MIQGSCYCRAVKYEIRSPPLKFLICHCPDCRKFTGSAFSPVVIVEAGSFHLLAGEDHLVPFQSSPGKYRYFCKTCGNPLFSRVDHRPGLVFVRAGSLDNDPGIRPEAHYWTSVKAPWHDICDAIPRHPEGLTAK